MHERDHSYRHLFARPQLIAELVREFVPEPWIQGLDFATLERVVEFQSCSERYMAVRMMGYVAAPYQDLIARGSWLQMGSCLW
jgi:hypothetical protein